MKHHDLARRMSRGTKRKTRVATMRHGDFVPGTRDARSRRLPTKNRHAATLPLPEVTREYQSDSSSKRPCSSALEVLFTGVSTPNGLARPRAREPAEELEQRHVTRLDGRVVHISGPPQKFVSIVRVADGRSRRCISSPYGQYGSSKRLDLAAIASEQLKRISDAHH